MFNTYEPSDSMLYIGNHSTTHVKGKGKINLGFTSGNTLTFKNVFRVPDIHKNLVSGSLLNKFGFKLVFESNKFILSKGGKFVGKGYHTGEMFKLNIKDVVNSSVNVVNMTEISDANDASTGIVNMTRIRSTRQRRQRTSGPDIKIYLVEGDRKDLPLGSKAIKSKWIFKRKLRVDGSIEKFKAQLVAKGFIQKEGLDYFDTYASVAWTTTIRILIALASINKLIVHQMDVKTAFLNGKLEGEVYIEQPKGFVIQGQEKNGDPSVLEGYTDASWITDQEDHASTSEWIFTLGGGAVSWGSKKQSCLTDSTMVVEFVALASCCKEA
nr:retrovirus-related Pol polyprotein from transposon TNT 1-94 [Tanacetum cinerariifolium]